MISTSDLQINTTMMVRNKYGKKEQINFIFPRILETKKDFCVIHNKSFDNECHRLPSLKEHWMGCPFCIINKDIKKRIDLIQQHMFINGMRYDITVERSFGNGKGEWVRINNPIQNEQPKKSNRGY